jgi:ATP-dependent DNA ligase
MSSDQAGRSADSFVPLTPSAGKNGHPAKLELQWASPASLRCHWHPDWIFEPKLDGFRSVAYVEGGACRLVSRNRNTFKTFVQLAEAISQELSGRSAILDGEIVRPGPDGRPMFWELMRRHGPFRFYAFDLLWLDGRDLRDRPLVERKALLRKLLPRHPKSVLYVDHVARGTALRIARQLGCNLMSGLRRTQTSPLSCVKDMSGRPRRGMANCSTVMPQELNARRHRSW